MPVRVSPTEPNPTHHLSLKHRDGTVIGLTLCDEKGEALGFYDVKYIKNPVTTTAMKQTTGASSYDIFEYPYSPIVQDDLSGGRGNLDFERDSTKFYDSFRCLSGRANKAYAGPLEQYTTWPTSLRSLNENMPGSVKWIQLTGDQRYIYKRFQASADYTIGLLWNLVRRKGKPGDLTIALYEDNAGDRGALLGSAVTVPYTNMDDVLMEWLNETVSQAVTNGTYYWYVISGDADDTERDHWKVACEENNGTTYTSETLTTTPTASSTIDLYFRTTPANTEKTCIPFEYKEGQYFIESGTTGAPKIFMAGDRGAADSNAGNLDKLIDATKSWTTDEWAGHMVLITDGTGKLETQLWRKIVSNSATELIGDEDWTIQHDTTTEYVILGTKIKEITDHGLTAPVTGVCVSPTGVIYCCMGDAVTVRRLRAFNDAGTWKDFGHADCKADETATTKAVHMIYKPQAQKLVISNNSDASGNVSCSTSSNATIPAWGVALTWSAAVNIDSKYRRINGLALYPDASGTEAVWVMKTDIPFILPGTGNPYPVSLEEMRAVRSQYNGRSPFRHGVYLYFPMLQGLVQYYGGQFNGVGPNLGEGLPASRRGPIVFGIGYPDKFFIGIDAGSGYSSVMDSGGWHERYRTPEGQRIRAGAFQVIPGTNLDRLWVYQGNDLIWLPFPSDSTNELEDENFEYCPEFAVELSRMHAGMYDVQKIIKELKLQTENLEVDVCWFELDYKVEDSEDWTTIDDIFTESPTQAADFTDIYGISGKRLKVRVRGYTTDKSKSPVLLAIIILAVTRVDVKDFYGPFRARFMDNEMISLREEDTAFSAKEKLELFEGWGDAANDSMLMMNSVASIMDEKLIFLNVGTRTQIGFKGQAGNDFKSDLYTVDFTVQEA